MRDDFLNALSSVRRGKNSELRRGFEARSTSSAVADRAPQSLELAPRKRRQCPMALPISSVIFLASPSSIMVLSR